MSLNWFHRWRRDWFIATHYYFLLQSHRTRIQPPRPHQSLNLYLGVGPYPIHPMHWQVLNRYPGPWVLVDKYVTQFGTLPWDAAQLPLKPSQAGVIYASHLLEHLPHPQIQAILNHWFQLLRPGGRIILAVPDLLALCSEFISLEQGHSPKSPVYPVTADYSGSRLSLLSIFYGSHAHPGEIHQSGFSAASLNRLLDQTGFTRIQISSYPDAHDFTCLHASAIKP